MPVNWIRTPARRHVAMVQRSYTYTADPSSGFMFDVDEATGTVTLDNDHARENYAKALAGVQAGTMIDEGVQDFGSEHWDAGAVQCPACRRTVELTDDWEGTRCQCGREFGGSGQELRANWREFCRETGELSDDDFLS